MNFLASNPVLAMVVFLGILVFVHELGHYLVGRAVGIGVEVFSLGFGPRLVGFRHGGTDYRISGLPFGGYVKFAGVVASEHVEPPFVGREMYRSPAWARAATILAGPLANLLLAFGIYTWMGYSGIEHPAPQIGAVLAGKPADLAGLEPGDYVLAIDGQPLLTQEEFRLQVAERPGQQLSLQVRRLDGSEHVLSVMPERVIEGHEQVGRIGVGFGNLPAIVTLSKEVRGLRTGDRIAAVSWGEQYFEVTGWYHLVYLFDRAYLDQSTQFVLHTQQNTQVVVDLAVWAHNRAELDASGSKVVRRERLAALLGMRHSQLTVTKTDVGPDVHPFQEGDILAAFAGAPVKNIYDLSEALLANESAQVEVEVLRQQVPRKLQVELEPITVQRVEGKATLYRLNTPFLGALEPPVKVIERYPYLVQALQYGWEQVREKASAIAQGLWQLITGNMPLKALGGPVLIAKIAGDAAEAGLMAFLGTMAIISINLGLINLVPLPAVDGGQLCVVFVEMIRRRPLEEEVFEQVQRLGFVILLALMILATYNDVSRFWTGVFVGR
ncbi:MAG: site-2 protease family protein [Zetaproteobacteria bacterium]|nr:site-2 protease family protein [Zetaproteobacteria bacterium]